MGLEVATNISQLVETNPLGTDNRAQGDDHIRLIKSCLKTTFTGVTGTVTATQDQLNAVASPGAINFPGMIVMWSGTVATIPAGWKLCNGTGTISTGGPVPNLVGRFVVASGTDSGGSFNINQIGGNNVHSHNIAVAGTSLTEAQLPPHVHSGGFAGYMQGVTGGGGMIPIGNQVNTGSAGSGQSHTHAAAVDAQLNVPLYYALAFLIKN